MACVAGVESSEEQRMTPPRTRSAALEKTRTTTPEKKKGGYNYNADCNVSKVPLNVVWEVPPCTEQPKSDFAVAVYNKIKPLNAALLDSYIDGYQRTTTLFFGRIVSNPDDEPAFKEPLGFNMTYNGMATHNGNALHRHNSVEIFVALDAPFEIAYGSNGEYKALLQPWDVVACPAEVIHSYKNMGHDGGQILTFLMGKPAIQWADGVVAKARDNGAVCTDSGILLDYTIKKKVGNLNEEHRKKSSSSDDDDEFETFDLSLSSASRQSTVTSVLTGVSEAETVASQSDMQDQLQRRLSLMGKEAPELVMNEGEMDQFVFRYSERSTRTFKMNASAGSMAVEWKDLQPGHSYSPEGPEDTLVIVLGGSVICQERHYTHLDVIKQPNQLKAGLQGAILLLACSALPHNLEFFFDADIMS
jgi:hypothetical protein